jgi:hypothetical protein
MLQILKFKLSLCVFQETNIIVLVYVGLYV